VKVVEAAGGTTKGEEDRRDLLSSLAGNQAGRDRAVAHRTRRVVLASLGVIKDQKAGSKRGRAMAVASILLVIIAMGPFVWRIADDIVGGEHWEDLATQASLWICLFFSAVLAALVAGWMRQRP
jgi:hypothetical protein